jgi:cobalt-zinc-cadmium efflux system protein
MAHSHSHAEGLTGRRLVWAIGLTLAFVIGEATAGFLSRSLALLSDAGHNFADALALVLSAYALWIARKPADATRTYGYHRVGILAALVNAVSLVVIALLIFWEAFQRLQHPEPVQGGPMIVVALVAIVMNTVIAFWLRGEAKHDLNMRSAYLHMAGDAVSALGVVVAGIVVALTSQSAADPIVSLLIGVLILWSSWGILTEAVNVLLEGVPPGLDLEAVEQAVRKTGGVDGVHHLHVWTVASGIVACSCHVLVGEQSASSGEQIHREVAECLKRRFGIGHTTIQVEVEGCEPHDLDCMKALRPSHGHGHTHTGHDHDGHH